MAVKKHSHQKWSNYWGSRHLLDLAVPIEQVNYLAGHKSMAMTKRYDHAHEERYGGAIEALDKVAKRNSAEVLAAARWKQV